jgi:hypothetical protein
MTTVCITTPISVISLGPEDLMPPEASGGNKALFAVIGKMLLGYGRKTTAEDPS